LRSRPGALAILTKLLRLPDSEANTAATLQQFAMSIVVDLLIMACFIAHEVMGWETRFCLCFRWYGSPISTASTLAKSSHLRSGCKLRA
jgi:hypothetical protein